MAKRQTEQLDLGELERRRRELGMSRANVAQRSGVSLPTVNRVLSGSAENVQFKNLEAISNTLGIGLVLQRTTDNLDFQETEARKKAERIVRVVQGSSALEAQALDAEAVEQLVRKTVHELMAGSRRRLWAST